MNPFEELMADFAEKTGLETGGPGADSIDVEADGVVVSAQYRAERDDCVIFSLPLEDAIPNGPMLRRALELAANGAGTGGHFLGLKEGMFMLSAVLPLVGLSAEEFGKRLLALAAASKRVADALLRASTEGNEGAKDVHPQIQGDNDFMRV
ncbi:MAG: type III secretion system chaperone [Victivallales bacterium]|nr:type III secretion system chaperone [Victivallales bacterium]